MSEDVPASLELKKVTLNLYDEDVKTLQAHFSTWGGFSHAIRDAVHNLARRIRKTSAIQQSIHNGK